jgi:PleD family two-component response regulator
MHERIVGCTVALAAENRRALELPETVGLPVQQRLVSEVQELGSEHDEQGLRVLVVDDEQAIRRYLRATLRAQGYHVTEAASGCLSTCGQNGTA